MNTDEAAARFAFSGGATTKTPREHQEHQRKIERRDGETKKILLVFLVSSLVSLVVVFYGAGASLAKALWFWSQVAATSWMQ